MTIKKYLVGNKHITVYKKPIVDINLLKIYGLYVSKPDGISYMYNSYKTEEGRNDAYRDATKSAYYKEHIIFVDRLYIEESEWPNHELYDEAIREEQIKNEYYRKQNEEFRNNKIKNDPCYAYRYLSLTTLQWLSCKIRCLFTWKKKLK